MADKSQAFLSVYSKQKIPFVSSAERCILTKKRVVTRAAEPRPMSRFALALKYAFPHLIQNILFFELEWFSYPRGCYTL